MPEPRPIERIVVATDGSKAAERALETALELAAVRRARLWILHVRSRAELLVETEPGVVAVRSTEEPDEVLERAGALAAEHGIEATLELRVGYAPERIAELAEGVDADLVVVGARGLGAVERLVLGSVSRAVLGLTRRPVLVVR